MGSRFYVESLSEKELAIIKVMLSFDVLATGRGVGVFGDEDITTMLSAIGREEGLEAALARGLRGGSNDFVSWVCPT